MLRPHGVADARWETEITQEPNAMTRVRYALRVRKLMTDTQKTKIQSHGDSLIPDRSFEELVDEALSWRFTGWDFSYLRGRLIEAHQPWDYSRIVRSHFAGTQTMVDLGTGGGELLSRLVPLPPVTCATEGYGPNVPVAARLLSPLGVEVIRACCDDNDKVPQRGSLPFRDSSVDLVIDRHESFKATEVYRVLKRGGFFVTQQVSSRLKSELNSFLGAKLNDEGWNLSRAREQLVHAGFSIIEDGEAEPRAVFKDIGAVVCYLRMVPWQIDDFDVRKYEEKLRRLDSVIRKSGSFVTHNCFFFLSATKE